MKAPVVGMMLLSTAGGCATVPTAPRVGSPPPGASVQGSYYRVQAGDTLWSIARGFGLKVETLAAANRLRDASRLDVGQQLFIPLPTAGQGFLWPLRGRHRLDASSKALWIGASAGSLVRAARSGRVAVAAQRLSGWGRTVLLDHDDGYVTIYSGLAQIMAGPGQFVPQGMSIGSVGSEGLHFEIRRGTKHKNPLALLP